MSNVFVLIFQDKQLDLALNKILPGSSTHHFSHHICMQTKSIVIQQKLLFEMLQRLSGANIKKILQDVNFLNAMF